MKAWNVVMFSLTKKIELVLTMNLKEIQVIPGILIGFWNRYYVNIGIHWLVFSADLTYTYKEQEEIN